MLAVAVLPLSIRLLHSAARTFFSQYYFLPPLSRSFFLVLSVVLDSMLLILPLNFEFSFSFLGKIFVLWFAFLSSSIAFHSRNDFLSRLFPSTNENLNGKIEYPKGLTIILKILY